MSIAPITSSSAAAVANAHDSVASLALDRPSHAATRFSKSSMRNTEPAEQRKAVAAQFEAILVRQLLGKSMTSLLGGEKGGVAGSVYGDMLSDTISQQLTSGPGLGLGRFLEKQLTPRGVPVDATAEQADADKPLLP